MASGAAQPPPSSWPPPPLASSVQRRGPLFPRMRPPLPLATPGRPPRPAGVLSPIAGSPPSPSTLAQPRGGRVSPPAAAFASPRRREPPPRPLPVVCFPPKLSSADRAASPSSSSPRAPGATPPHQTTSDNRVKTNGERKRTRRKGSPDQGVPSPDPTKAESAPDHGATKRDSGFPFLGSGYQPLELDRPILGVVRSCSSRPCCPAKFGGRAHKGPRPPCLAVPFGLDKDRPSIPPGRSVTHCSFGAQTGLRSVSRDVCLSMPLLSIRIKLLL